MKLHPRAFNSMPGFAQPVLRQWFPKGATLRYNRDNLQSVIRFGQELDVDELPDEVIGLFGDKERAKRWIDRGERNALQG